LLKFEGKLIIN